MSCTSCIFQYDVCMWHGRHDQPLPTVNVQYPVLWLLPLSKLGIRNVPFCCPPAASDVSKADLMLFRLYLSPNCAPTHSKTHQTSLHQHPDWTTSCFCGSVPHLLVPTPKGWKDNVPHLMAMSKAPTEPVGNQQMAAGCGKNHFGKDLISVANWVGYYQNGKNMSRTWHPVQLTNLFKRLRYQLWCHPLSHPDVDFSQHFFGDMAATQVWTLLLLPLGEVV